MSALLSQHWLINAPNYLLLICRNFYKMDLGPKPGVSLRVAVLAEGALTYLLNLVILYATSELPVPKTLVSAKQQP